ncbi:hypothetical protein PS029_21015 [Yersinia pestis]|nr:hypothetical protein [Yersinia pestis]MDL1139844.1 hypothetical protein [Yersinia pestis]
MEIATLPPSATAAKLQMPDFLLSERRKSGEFLFTADTSSGNAVNAIFPRF